MILTTSYKSNQFLWLSFKLIVAFGCLYFIVDKLINNSEISFSQFVLNAEEFKLLSIKNIFILLIFSIFNWFFEILKWKTLVSKIKIISWKEATKQSLSSLAFSLFTPNRIGEYGAKAFFFTKKDWKKVLVLNALGNGCQLLATLFFGIFGTLFYYNELLLFFQNINFKTLLSILTLGIILLFSAYIFKRLKKIYSYFQSFSKSFHIKILIISFVRFLLFSNQFVFALYIFQSQVNYVNTICAIFLIYLVSSLIPMLSFLDVIVKGSISIIVLSWLDIHASVAISTSIIMWFFNFALPSIAGSFYILRLQYKWN